MRRFKAVLSSVILVSSFMLVSTASACSWSWDWNNGCYENNNSSVQNGNGSNGGNTETNIVYLPPKASQYGAVAWNNDNNEFGSSFSQKNSRAAKKQALINCGGGNCKIVSTYSNQCVALAWGRKPNGFSFGPIKYNLSLV